MRKLIFIIILLISILSLHAITVSQLKQMQNSGELIVGKVEAKIKTPINGFREAGYYSVIWNGKDSNGKPVSSGIYFYRMCLHPDSSGRTDKYQKIRKMVLLK